MSWKLILLPLEHATKISQGFTLEILYIPHTKLSSPILFLLPVCIYPNILLLKLKTIFLLSSIRIPSPLTNIIFHQNEFEIWPIIPRPMNVNVILSTHTSINYFTALNLCHDIIYSNLYDFWLLLKFSKTSLNIP